MKANMNKIAIFPGTFDPLTYGHVDLIQRACKLLNKVILAIATSERKMPLFSIERRLCMAKSVFADLKNLEICAFDGLLVDLAEKKQAEIILRGIRSLPDTEYEFQLANMNRRMNANIETILLPASPEFTYVSSSIVREIATMGGDVSAFVPPVVVQAFNDMK
jgi:pantetheine-phosphate adenylyltransferase